MESIVKIIIRTRLRNNPDVRAIRWLENEQKPLKSWYQRWRVQLMSNLNRAEEKHPSTWKQGQVHVTQGPGEERVEQKKYRRRWWRRQWGRSPGRAKDPNPGECQLLQIPRQERQGLPAWAESRESLFHKTSMEAWRRGNSVVYMVQRSRRAWGRTHSPRKKACGTLQGRTGWKKRHDQATSVQAFQLDFLPWDVFPHLIIKLDSILKSRDISLSTKVRLVNAMVFPVVMYGCESWTVKKAEHRRIDAFDLWCWRRLLRVPWTARRSNQSILKEISPRCSLEGMMLELKLQYFGHLMWRVDSL